MFLINFIVKLILIFYTSLEFDTTITQNYHGKPVKNVFLLILTKYVPFIYW